MQDKRYVCLRQGNGHGAVKVGIGSFMVTVWHSGESQQCLPQVAILLGNGLNKDGR